MLFLPLLKELAFQNYPLPSKNLIGLPHGKLIKHLWSFLQLGCVVSLTQVESRWERRQVSARDGVTGAAGRSGESVREFEMQKEEKRKVMLDHTSILVKPISITIFNGPSQMSTWGYAFLWHSKQEQLWKIWYLTWQFFWFFNWSFCSRKSKEGSTEVWKKQIGSVLLLSFLGDLKLLWTLDCKYYTLKP